MDQYFEVCGGEDGVYVKKIPDINKFLDQLVRDEESKDLLEDFPENYYDKSKNRFDTECYGCDDSPRVIIKGRIVFPKKIEVITKFEIE